MTLDLGGDPVALTAALVDVPSVSGDEEALTDEVERALRGCGHLRVERVGNVVVGRTVLGRPSRVLLAGHLDTVPTADNVPSRWDAGLLYGCGTSDMKSGVAVLLHVAATIPEPARDVTVVLYDNEEVDAASNGLGRLAGARPELLEADLAILLEPTSGRVEAGCQGSLRVRARVTGRRAHSARSWLGENAIHRTAGLLSVLGSYRAREVEIDGCTYREGLSAVAIEAGVAGNVVPDECLVTVNFRFAPDRSEEQALAHVSGVLSDVLAGAPLELLDSSPAAPPGLSAPLAREFLAATGQAPVAKYGWTDVARFAALGIPALNFGPGDPNLAHTRDEHVDPALVRSCADGLAAFLS